MNPKSTSNQSSKPCTVLQYPSRKAYILPSISTKSHARHIISSEFKSEVSFAEYSLFLRALLQKSPIIETLSHNLQSACEPGYNRSPRCSCNCKETMHLVAHAIITTTTIITTTLVSNVVKHGYMICPLNSVYILRIQKCHRLYPELITHLFYARKDIFSRIYVRPTQQYDSGRECSEIH